MLEHLPFIAGAFQGETVRAFLLPSMEGGEPTPLVLGADLIMSQMRGIGLTAEGARRHMLNDFGASTAVTHVKMAGQDHVAFIPLSARALVTVWIEAGSVGPEARGELEALLTAAAKRGRQGA
jgi:hypothetical protein